MKKDTLLIDTSIIIDFLRGYKPAINFLNNLKTINISVVTQAELIEGCRHKDDLIKIKKLIAIFEIISINYQISKTAIKLLEDYYLQQGILFDDALVAATAIENNLTLATTDKKHFKPLKNLTLYYPY